MNTQTLQKLKSAMTEVKTVTRDRFDTHSGKPLNINAIRSAVHEALLGVANVTVLCLNAGQMLNEVQDSLEHGQFQPWIEKYLPEISNETARRWARAAANVVKALPPPAIDLAISDILVTPEADLGADAKKYKQAWLDFTSDKSINECLKGVCVEGDDAVRADRAINGKTKGGKGRQDRKDFSFFIAVKMNDIACHLANWPKYNALQKSEVQQILRGAILGQDVTLTRGAHARMFDFAGTERRRAMWPRELCQLAMAALKERLKQSE